MTEKPIAMCPNCGKPDVERLISPGSGFLFKGSGFYITDYRKESYKKDSKKESGDSTPAKPETKKDSGDSGQAKPSADTKSKPKPSDAA